MSNRYYVLAIAVAMATNSPMIAKGQADSLIVNYLFNGNSNDASGNGNHGTISGAVLTEDRFGNPDAAYFFDGSDDFIGMPAIWGGGSNQLTAAAWFAAEATANEGKVVYHGNNGEFQILVDGTSVSAGVHTLSGWQFVSSPISSNSWNSAALTWERGQFARLFVNGALVDSLAVPDEPLLDVGPSFAASVGSYGRTLGAYFSGSIDDVRIYGRALSKDEIIADYFWSTVGTDSPNRESPLSTIGNHPNPFSTWTIIEIEFPRRAQVQASIYNILGQRVATVIDGPVPAGLHSVTLDATGLPSGAYVFVTDVDGTVRTKTLTKIDH